MKIKRAFLIVVILSLLFCGAANSLVIEVYFSPNGGCADRIVSLLDSAKSFIDVAMFSFTSRELARALIRAHERGVRVRVLLDRHQAEERFSKGRYLAKRGIFVVYDRMPGLMHNKFCVIDSKIVITGSYNWTASAEKRNQENLVIIHDSKIARIFERRMEYLLKLNVPWWKRLLQGS
ncbi:MAG: phospholipase D family protein [Synergistetes bacterium]|nr:phospholipase D family protein [Synergistota bacterium]